MDSSLLELLTKVTLLDLIWAIILIVTLAVILISQKKKISKLLNKWRKDKNEEEDFTKLVYSLRDTVARLEQTVDQFQGNREHDRDDSRKVRSEMYEVINKQSDEIKELTNIVVKMEERNSKTKRAELKEKIERIYSECHPAMTCTDMQLETLKDLIEEYEEHGGTNSFVHSTVEPEMYEWKRIEKIRRPNNV